MKFLIVLSESPLKVRKITIYRFLISFLVPELSRFKDMKSDRKNDNSGWRILVTNYHDAGCKVSKSSLDRGRKQKRPLRQTAVDAWRG